MSEPGKEQSIASRLTSLVEGLSSKLGVATDQIKPTLTNVYKTFVKQSKLEGLMWVIGGFTAIIFGTFLLYMSRLAVSDDGKVFYALFGILSYLFAATACSFSAISLFINPEFRALTRLKNFIAEIVNGL